MGVKAKAFPTVYESVAEPIKSLLQGRRRRRHVTALNSVSIVLEPGRLYLVLGGPKSGKTSLLKAIASTWPPGYLFMRASYPPISWWLEAVERGRDQNTRSHVCVYASTRCMLQAGYGSRAAGWSFRER